MKHYLALLPLCLLLTACESPEAQEEPVGFVVAADFLEYAACGDQGGSLRGWRQSAANVGPERSLS